MEDGADRTTLEGRLYACDRLLAFLLARLPEEEFERLKQINLEEDSWPDRKNPAGEILVSEARRAVQDILSWADILRRGA